MIGRGENVEHLDEEIQAYLIDKPESASAPDRISVQHKEDK